MTQQRRKGREKDRKRGRRKTGSTETNDSEKSRNSRNGRNGRKRKQMLCHLTSRYQETTREETERQAINRDCRKCLMSQKDIAKLAEAAAFNAGRTL